MKTETWGATALLVLTAAAIGSTSAGVLDPDCTAEKAAKSAAAKATVGVGGRCDAKEAAKDTASEAVDLDLDEHKDKVEDARDDARDKVDDAGDRVDDATHKARKIGD
jgi:hypothetical protein